MIGFGLYIFIPFFLPRMGKFSCDSHKHLVLDEQCWRKESSTWIESKEFQFVSLWTAGKEDLKRRQSAIAAKQWRTQRPSSGAILIRISPLMHTTKKWLGKMCRLELQSKGCASSQLPISQMSPIAPPLPHCPPTEHGKRRTWGFLPIRSSRCKAHLVGDLRALWKSEQNKRNIQSLFSPYNKGYWYIKCQKC